VVVLTYNGVFERLGVGGGGEQGTQEVGEVVRRVVQRLVHRVRRQEKLNEQGWLVAR
jgi:hypothetical protein